ncbi:MAG: GumC family protein [Verrucomicrobiota bacterium]
MTDSQDTLHFLDYWRVIRSRKEIVIAVTLMVVLGGVLFTLTRPKVFAASTLIQVHQEGRKETPVFTGPVNYYDPLFLTTQFEIIQSRPVIEEVIRRRSLDKKLAKAYEWSDLPEDTIFEMAVKLLSDRMKVQQYRDTNLIEIQIYLSEPSRSVRQEVAEVANTVADVFRDQQLRNAREQKEQDLEALYTTLQEHEQRIEAQASKVQEIREEHELDVVGGRQAPETFDMTSMLRLEEFRIRTNMEMADKKARYETINNLSPEALLDAGPRVVGDASLLTLVEKKRNAAVELSRLRNSLGPNHPDVISVQATIKQLDVQIKDALRGLKVGVRADYEAAKAKYDILEKELEAKRMAERVEKARAYRDFEVAQKELERLKKVRDVIEMRWLEEKIELRIPKKIVEVREEAVPPKENNFVSPKSALNVILSLIVGLGCGIGLAFFVEYLDTSVKTIEDIETSLGVPVLGVIPQKVQPFTDPRARSEHAEAYRVLRTNIRFSKQAQNGRTFCVTSGSICEGKSLTVFNLGCVCADTGDKVMVVDSDLHRPKQHKMMGLSNSMGFANVLAGENSLDEALVKTEYFDFLPSGRLEHGSHGLLNTSRVRGIIDEFKSLYDIVIFDSAPVIGVSDALMLASEMDGVLMVIQHRKYPKAVSNRAKEMIESTGANLVGVVLNNINISRDYSYYYHHYHSYQYSGRSENRGAEGKDGKQL